MSEKNFSREYEREPIFYVEHMYKDSDKPGVDFFRVHYGSSTIFIGEDGSIDTARNDESQAEKDKIWKCFKVWRNSAEGKEQEGELRRKMEKYKEEMDSLEDESEKEN